MPVYYGAGEIFTQTGAALVPDRDVALCPECGFWYCGDPSKHHSSCSRYAKPTESKLKESQR